MNIYLKGESHLEVPGRFLFYISDKDLIFLKQAIMGIKKDLKKKKKYFV